MVHELKGTKIWGHSDQEQADTTLRHPEVTGVW